jgi:hypothetical protein
VLTTCLTVNIQRGVDQKRASVLCRPRPILDVLGTVNNQVSPRLPNREKSSYLLHSRSPPISIAYPPVQPRPPFRSNPHRMGPWETRRRSQRRLRLWDSTGWGSVTSTLHPLHQSQNHASFDAVIRRPLRPVTGLAQSFACTEILAVKQVDKSSWASHFPQAILNVLNDLAYWCGL